MLHVCWERVRVWCWVWCWSWERVRVRAEGFVRGNMFTLVGNVFAFVLSEPYPLRLRSRSKHPTSVQLALSRPAIVPNAQFKGVIA